MKIIYVSTTCSNPKYKEYVESKGARISQQAQKYNLLLAEGLAKAGAVVHLISSRPINRNIQKKLWFRREKENVNGIEFSYIPFINYPILRNIFVFFGTFAKILLCHDKRNDTFVICDALNIASSLAAQIASALKGYLTVGIVTDVPCHFSNMNNIPFYQKLNLAIMRKFQSYLLLTEHMSDVVNPKNHPFIVLEGHSDVSMANIENTLEGKIDKKICMYAGSLRRIYGIKNLVEGFVSAGVPDTELHIYGDGDYLSELKDLCNKYDNIKYLGIAPNSEIVKAELCATLLVNPRPTGEEYTKYSFPSKNMEYMASGTPVLTTELPGMPDDHKPYVFLLKDESADGIEKELKNILAKSPEELFQKGREAKEFILREKNNIKQAEKVIEFLKNL